MQITLIVPVLIALVFGLVVAAVELLIAGPSARGRSARGWRGCGSTPASATLCCLG